MRLARLTALAAAVTFAVLAVPPAAMAQQVGKVYRIGLLRNGPPPETFMEAYGGGCASLATSRVRTSALSVG